MALKIFTIGVYGADEASFFAALRAAQIDTFCDIRRRRGMRGSLYAFANRARLQQRLAEMGIRYLHLKDLAPGEAIRARQKEEDKRLKIAKHTRQALGAGFSAAFAGQLTSLDPAAVLAQLGPEAHNVVLFCVECDPAACHRSLVAEWLRQAEDAAVEHLQPCLESSTAKQ